MEPANHVRPSHLQPFLRVKSANEAARIFHSLFRPKNTTAQDELTTIRRRLQITEVSDKICLLHTGENITRQRYLILIVVRVTLFYFISTKL